MTCKVGETIKCINLILRHFARFLTTDCWNREKSEPFIRRRGNSRFFYVLFIGPFSHIDKHDCFCFVYFVSLGYVAVT